MLLNNLLPEILPCHSCRKKPETLETSKPEGRLRDLYRIICTCGKAAPKWSVTNFAAVRLWNWTMADAAEQT